VGGDEEAGIAGVNASVEEVERELSKPTPPARAGRRYDRRNRAEAATSQQSNTETRVPRSQYKFCIITFLKAILKLILLIANTMYLALKYVKIYSY
jgi:hypothetical protein